MDVLFKQLDETLEAPAYARPGDAGLDLRAAEGGHAFALRAGTRALRYRLGRSRGLCGAHHSPKRPGGTTGHLHRERPGLIDSGYRGEIKVPLINLDPTEVFNYEKGERIAQLVIIATPTITLHNTYELPESSRGAQGFGSSGLS